MSETTLQLVPNGKPEFLARVGPLLTPSSSGSHNKGGLPMTELHLDGYTRDAWANAKDSSVKWKSIHLKSVDGRHKLPGFLNFLKQRQKSAYGRFASTPTTRGVVVVPLQQIPPPTTEKNNNTNHQDDEIIFCRYVLDERTIPGFPHAPSSSSSVSSKSVPPPPRQPLDPPNKDPPVQRRNTATVPKQSTSSTTSAVSRGGMLGNLLGAQRRTNQHLAVVLNGRTKETHIPTASTTTMATTDSVTGVGSDNGSIMTSGQVITRFRQSMEQRLLDFKQSQTTSIKINVSLAKITSDLPNDQKGNITMDVLKYVVYEQAEEIGEDEWVASKEPSEFLDEVIIAVYKQGHAPADVMEDLMKGDLPDEQRGQERAMREARIKEQARKEAKAEKLRHKETIGKGHVMTPNFEYIFPRDSHGREELVSGSVVIGNVKSYHTSLLQVE
eukprot:scaffold421175_cov51-Attheya_sp.AAC.3